MAWVRLAAAPRPREGTMTISSFAWHATSPRWAGEGMRGCRSEGSNVTTREENGLPSFLGEQVRSQCGLARAVTSRGVPQQATDDGETQANACMRRKPPRQHRALHLSRDSRLLSAKDDVTPCRTSSPAAYIVLHQMDDAAEACCTANSLCKWFHPTT